MEKWFGMHIIDYFFESSKLNGLTIHIGKFIFIKLNSTKNKQKF